MMPPTPHRRSGLSLLALALVFASTLPMRAAEIERISINLSHRIVLLESIETRLKLMIGFRVTGDLAPGPAGTRAVGTLSRNGATVANYTMPRLDHLGGNLVFYMPYDIPSGDYDLRIELQEIASGAMLVQHDSTVNDIEDLCAREGTTCHWREPLDVPLENPDAERLDVTPSAAEIARGYLLWQRESFRYVYPNSAPSAGELVTALSLRMAAGEYEPLTLSLRALQSLDPVTISVSALSGPATLPAPELRLVRSVPRLNADGDAYEMKPRLLDTLAPIAIAGGSAQRYWMTLRTEVDTPPGQYGGTITIETQHGQQQFPLHVEVLPFALTERPDREYGLMMDYAFQEMTAQDLTDAERAMVYENGVDYYRSFKQHGLTTVFPHSPFVFSRLPDGSPDLRDLQAALAAYDEVDFSGPFFYYCGHLVQSSKPDWAGSSLGFDAAYHPALIQEIADQARDTIPTLAQTEFYWMAGDEIHDDHGGPDRQAITRLLMETLWTLGEKTTTTANADIDWPIDIKLVKKEWGAEPQNGVAWQYPNKQTITPDSVDDPAKLRNEFGLAHLSTDYVGIIPWTFQTSQNANGDPFTDIDTSRGAPEVMLAYPGLDGPTPTPEYEAMREGIDDGRYGWALEQRIATAKASNDGPRMLLAIQIEADYLQLIDASPGATLSEMRAARNQLIDWILALDAAIEDPPGPPDPPTELAVY